MIDTVFSRHRPLALLASVIVAQILLLAFQIKRDHDVRLIRYWSAAVVMPFERGGTWSFSRIGGLWEGYIALHGAHTENARLRDELNQLQMRNRELETEAGEAHRLSALLNFRDAHPEAQMLAAQVIGASADPASRTLFVNRGDRDHVHRDMAVITPDGIVGKIVEVFPGTAQVLLIDDKDSGVGALLADTRTHGVVKGSGNTGAHLDYVVNDEKVHPGEILLTSGEDRIFPKGLLIGSVTNASPGNPFQVIHIQPAARLDRLEDVIILLSQQELTARPASASTGEAGAQPESSGVVAAQALAPGPSVATPTNSTNPATAPAAKPQPQTSTPRP